MIDEIDKQSTMWTVNFVDSKPHYTTLIILTSAVHCACAVCNMQWAVCSVKCAVPISKNWITVLLQGNPKPKPLILLAKMKKTAKKASLQAEHFQIQIDDR